MGSFKCKRSPILPQLSCPSSTGTLSVSAGQFVPDATHGRNLWRFAMALHFTDATECQLDTFSPFQLGGYLGFGSRLRAPTVFFGTFVCTKGGVEWDHGSFAIWQQGSVH
jgi:hypothetical protein